MVETRIAAAVMSEQIVVESDIPSTPDAAVAMFSFMMNRRIQGLRDNAPLHCCIGKSIKRSILISSPAD
jgi:hypothetical protein